MATLQAAPQIVVRRASSDRTSRSGSRQVLPFHSYKVDKNSILVDTWITNLKEPEPLLMAVKQDSSAAPDASAPSESELAAPNEQLGSFSSRQPTCDRAQPANGVHSSTSYDAADRATLLRKCTVHPTSSRRLRGLADAGLMLLALLPTVLLRLIRTAMGLLGITEHRWRGISMVLPLTLDDRKQLEVTARNLVAGRLGRRPEPPRRGPVPPATQLLLDTHAILAAAASTAAAFSLPYDGAPEATLQSKLASYLRSVAATDSVCPQDCLKAMRKIARKALTALCAAAPRLPASPPPPFSSSAASIILATLHASPSGSGPRSSGSNFPMISRPKKRTVAKAFMSACLLELSRSQPDTLVHLVARLPDGVGDLVETCTLVPLAPGAEYLRLLGAAAGEPGAFAEQLEAAAEFGRLRPSDAKKDPAMQGMAINARVHGVGVVRYAALEAAAGGLAAAAAAALPTTLRGGGERERGPEDALSRLRREMQQREEEEEEEERQQQQGRGGDGNGEVQRAGQQPREGAAAAPPRGGGGGGVVAQQQRQGDGADEGEDGGDMRERISSEGGASASSEGDGGDTEELLRRVRKHQTTSSQPDLTDPNLQTTTAATATAAPTPTASKKAAALMAATASTLRRAAAAAAAAVSAATTSTSAAAAAAEPPAANGHGAAACSRLPTAPQRQQQLRGQPPSFTAASGPSTCITLYPTAALDVFQPIYAVPRSGAFAVHGRRPRGVGLSRLLAAHSAAHSLPAAGQAALLRQLGYGSLEELRGECELRKALCVAQALPVVIASLRLMCGSAACLRSASRTGSFLHCQQSLLSDLHRHERGYLEDTKGALDVLSERLVVRFVEGSEKVLPLHISGSSAITVSLPSDCVSSSALEEAGLDRSAFCGSTYGLTALLLNMGINSLQSLGFLTWGWGAGAGEPLQDTINKHSLERLNEYAARAGAAGGPALAALNRHYSAEGRRPPKDTDMFCLVRRACSEVGGGRAVNCKSGKDRTALEVSKALADEVVAAVQAAGAAGGTAASGGGAGGGGSGGGSGLLPAGQRDWLEGQFLRGLSYMTTSANHGQPPAYAFNEMELATLPPGWKPDWRLCGKVAT
ncbi:hypothetical protein PLESTF_000471800 [Pleodorina starrii]|nr:hypothetical protein PLESTM_001767200 [Pleodorina starrii]GLC66762.1 hypothetical protein PLESTF_000471800 [Pleodorina starrii]